MDLRPDEYKNVRGTTFSLGNGAYMLISILFSFFFSLTGAIAIIFTKDLHGHLTLDGDEGVQKVHRSPTPRIGGIALFLGAGAGGLSMPSSAQALWWIICFAALPAFTVGLIEDITKRVSVKARLFATILAGLIFSALSGYHIARIDLPGFDWVLSFWFPSLIFTALAIGGIANAINIIDGVHGLASGTSIIIASGFAILSWYVGDKEMMYISLVVVAALGGFFLVNFPLGKLFLGDAGAYTSGFLLAVIAITLPQRNQEISPLVGLLALVYPVTETLVSVHRRVERKGTHPGQADRLHLHSLVYRSHSLRLSRRLGVPKLRNAFSAIIIFALPLFSTLAVVLSYQSRELIIANIALMVLIYLAAYRKVALLGSLTRSRAYRRVLQSTAKAKMRHWG